MSLVWSQSWICWWKLLLNKCKKCSLGSEIIKGDNNELFIACCISTLSPGVSSFKVIANDDKLYRVGSAGGSFFFHNKVAPALWCEIWEFSLEASSLTTQYMLSSHLPIRDATLVPSASLTKPWTLHRIIYISMIYISKGTEGSLMEIVRHTWRGLRSRKDCSLNISLHEYFLFPLIFIVPWWWQYTRPMIRLLIVVVTLQEK